MKDETADSLCAASREASLNIGALLFLLYQKGIFTPEELRLAKLTIISETDQYFAAMMKDNESGDT